MLQEVEAQSVLRGRGARRGPSVSLELEAEREQMVVTEQRVRGVPPDSVGPRGTLESSVRRD